MLTPIEVALLGREGGDRLGHVLQAGLAPFGGDHDLSDGRAARDAASADRWRPPAMAAWPPTANAPMAHVKRAWSWSCFSPLSRLKAGSAIFRIDRRRFCPIDNSTRFALRASRSCGQHAARLLAIRNSVTVSKAPQGHPTSVWGLPGSVAAAARRTSFARPSTRPAVLRTRNKRGYFVSNLMEACCPHGQSVTPRRIDEPALAGAYTRV